MVKLKLFIILCLNALWFAFRRVVALFFDVIQEFRCFLRHLKLLGFVPVSVRLSWSGLGFFVWEDFGVFGGNFQVLLFGLHSHLIHLCSHVVFPYHCWIFFKDEVAWHVTFFDVPRSRSTVREITVGALCWKWSAFRRALGEFLTSFILLILRSRWASN